MSTEKYKGISMKALYKFAKQEQEEKKGASVGNVVATGVGALGVGAHASIGKELNSKKFIKEMGRNSFETRKALKIMKMSPQDVSSTMRNYRRGQRSIGKANKAGLAAAGLMAAAGIANMHKKKEEE